MDLSKITSTPDAVNVIIEIGADADPVKYEFNKEFGLLQVDRFYLPQWSILAIMDLYQILVQAIVIPWMFWY